MKVEMLVRLTWQNQLYDPRMGIVEIPDNVANDWADRGICKIVKTVKGAPIEKPKDIAKEVKPKDKGEDNDEDNNDKVDKVDEVVNDVKEPEDLEEVSESKPVKKYEHHVPNNSVKKVIK